MEIRNCETCKTLRPARVMLHHHPASPEWLKTSPCGRIFFVNSQQPIIYNTISYVFFRRFPCHSSVVSHGFRALLPSPRGPGGDHALFVPGVRVGTHGRSLPLGSGAWHRGGVRGSRNVYTIYVFDLGEFRELLRTKWWPEVGETVHDTHFFLQVIMSLSRVEQSQSRALPKTRN